MTFTIRSNMADTLLESSGKTDSTSGRRCETMALLNLLQEGPIGINRSNGSHGCPPKRPSRQLTMQDLEGVLSMAFDDDLSCYDDDVSTLSCRSVHEPPPRDISVLGPKYPCRRQSLHDSWIGDEYDDDNEDFNCALLRRSDRCETNTETFMVAPQNNALSPSFLPPKLPQRSVDKSYDRSSLLDDDDDDDDDDNRYPSTVHGTGRQYAAGFSNSMGPPKLPSRNSSCHSGSDVFEDAVRKLGIPELKRGMSLPIDILNSHTTVSDESAEGKVEDRGSNPPRFPRRRRSNTETCLH